MSEGHNLDRGPPYDEHGKPLFWQDSGEADRSRAEIEAELDEAEQTWGSHDPYRRAAGYEATGQLFEELSIKMHDNMLVAACEQAGEHYQTLAARIRFNAGIPTMMPRREAALLGMNRQCAHCGRAWSLDPTGGCEHCPRLLVGPTPQSAAEAEHLPPPHPA